MSTSEIKEKKKNFWLFVEQRLRRESAGETRADYALRVLRVSRQRYNKILTKNRKPSVQHLIGLVKAGFPKLELLELICACYENSGDTDVPKVRAKRAQSLRRIGNRS